MLEVRRFMTDQTCQNCRHWEESGWCNYVNVQYKGEQKAAWMQFETWNNPSATFRTLPTFSCNQFQPREE
jgi:hypothetical protein